MILGCYDSVSALHRALKIQGLAECVNELMTMEHLDRSDIILTVFYDLPEASELRKWIRENVDMSNRIICHEEEEIELNWHWTDLVNHFMKLGSNYTNHAADILGAMKMHPALGYATVREIVTLPEISDTVRAAIRWHCPEYKRLCIFSTGEHVHAIHALGDAVMSADVREPLPKVSGNYNDRHVPFIKTRETMEMAEAIYSDYVAMKKKLKNAIALYEKLDV